jgi:hypothetical protein
MAACTTYTVSGLADAAAKTAACSAIATTDSKCTWWPGTGVAACIAVGACTSYVGTTSATVATDCAAQK